MVDFVDEVNEELRRERFSRFWQKVGAYVVTVSVTIILATVASVLWDKHRETRQEEAAEAFLAAAKLLPSGNYEKAAQQFDAVAQMSAEGFPALANLRKAYALVQAGDEEQALAAYQAVIDDSEAEAGVRALSRIYAATLMADMEKPVQEAMAVLEPLASDNSNPFSAFAREQKALLTLQSGDVAAAQTLFSQLSADVQAPASIRRRAQAQLASIDNAAAE
jgi:hypothetical protein